MSGNILSFLIKYLITIELGKIWVLKKFSSRSIFKSLDSVESKIRFNSLHISSGLT
jgi:hypothetical protein